MKLLPGILLTVKRRLSGRLNTYHAMKFKGYRMLLHIQ